MSDPATPAPGVPPMSRRDLEARIVAKAWRDPAFKQQLLANPRATMQAELSLIDSSIFLPTALQIHVHEETPNLYHLVLPRNPHDISLGEVLGENLDAVAPQTVAVVTMTNITTTTNAVQVVVAYPMVNLVGNATIVTTVVSNVVA